VDVLVQSRRNAVAAKRFFRKLLKDLRYVPPKVLSDAANSNRWACPGEAKRFITRSRTLVG